MKTRTLQWFDSLSKRDFENGAVISEIRDVFKQRDKLLEFVEALEKQPVESHKAAVARRRAEGGHFG